MIKERIKRQILRNLINKERAREENIVMSQIPESVRTPLTEAEKYAVDEMCGKIMGGGNSLSYNELEVYKFFNGFDPRYLGHNLYLPLVARRLNDYHYTKFFEDKGLFGRLSSEIVAPTCLVRCIDGEYYNNDLGQISESEAKRICQDYNGDIIVKPSRNSSGGKKVIKLTSEQRTNGWLEQISENYGCDWTVQKCIKQHESLAAFNLESVNTFRITSLYLNGKASICSSVLRFGTSGSVVDNCGSGGRIIGVHEDGTLYKYAINKQAECFNEANGKKFTEISLPYIPTVYEHILRSHIQDFSLCKFIGWDVCIDHEGRPIVIEINSSQPGIFYEQICTGPIFGDRTEEVIDYVSGKEFKYGIGLLNI